MSTTRGNGIAAGGNGAGVVPPHNLEAEQSVIGAILLSDQAMYKLVIDDGLRPEHFYRERHRTIYGAMLDLYNSAEPVDLITVTENLRQAGQLESVGGAEAVTALVGAAEAPGNVRHYAQIVRDNALLRGLLGAAYEVQHSVATHDGPPRELVERAEKAMLEVAQDERRKGFTKIDDVLHEELEKLHRLSTNKTAITGTPSGFRDLDQLTGGFQPGNLVILAARPSMGKSSLVTNIAEHAAIDHDCAVALFSLEMSESELAQRFIASQARIRGEELRKGRVPEARWDKILHACERLSRAPLYIDDSSDVGLLDIRAKARRLHSQHEGGLGLVIVDYLQLMRSDGRTDNRVEQVSQMSRGLKVLARELDVPVIALSQLNRAVENRKPPKPILADLRESGCLAGESRVFLPDSGRYAPIRALAGATDFQVLALDPTTWRVEPRRARRAFSTGNRPVFRLRTSLGRELRATANHRFLTIDGWRRLDELESGVHIALPRKLAGPDRSSMTAAELSLLGHLIGDGCTLPRHAIQFTTNELLLAELVASLATEVFGESVRPRIVQERSWYQVYLAATQRLTHGVHNPVATWLTGLDAFGRRAWEKAVPDAVFEQPEELIATFLRHLWSADGSISFASYSYAPNHHQIYYATSSVQLARDIQALLLRLGVASTLHRGAQRAKGRLQHHVSISGASDVRLFLDRIGGLGAKADAADRVRHLLSERPNTNRDVVPRSAWRSRVVPTMAATGVTTRQLQAQLGTAYCGSALYKANLSRARAARVAKILKSEELAYLAASDVYWDRVASIEPDGTADVFDIEVEGLHNFVAEDVVVHNSIEQDADVVIFIYRDEYYEEDSEREGEADLLIQKHRNGPLGSVKLTFQKEFPRFMNYAPADFGQ